MASNHEHALYFHLRREKLVGWTPEYRFKGRNGKRRWRFDVAFPQADPPVAIDVQGGLWMKGGNAHGKPEQMKRDSIKQAEANMCGWIFIALTPEMIEDGSGVGLIREALGRTDES